MEKVVHREGDRGRGDHGWLTTRYSFSFSEWYEPTRMGFGKLRVLNDDVIAPGTGFGMHGHKDMEIVTIVMQGSVSHKDSLGNEKQVPAGEVQVMSAGTGVIHAEQNDSKEEPLALFQLWIEPNHFRVEPRYEQKSFHFEKIKKGLITLVSTDGADKSLVINQDATISYAVIDAKNPLTYALSKGRGAYIFVIEGEIDVEKEFLGSRDAIGVWDAKEVGISSPTGGRILIIEVPV